jgi:thiamine kinase-like enzyme
MANSVEETKLVIAWVDHEKDKVEKFIRSLGDREWGGDITPQKLSQLYTLVPIAISIVKNNDPEKLALSIVEKLNHLPQFPDMVFVDINIGPPSSTGEKRAADIGIGVGLELKRRIWPTPVGMYSAFHLKSSDKVRITSLNFAAMLESVNDLVGGTDFLTGDEWDRLFRGVVKRSKERQNELPYALTQANEIRNVVWAEDSPSSRSLSFIRAAPKLVVRALEYLHLSNSSVITISQLSGGFSGSYVVKAELSEGQAAFVIKIDEDPQKLIAELEGYRRVESKLNFNHYIQVRAFEPVRLTNEWWGAFAISYDGDAKPLLEQSMVDGAVLAKLYKTLWNECLSNLYGSPYREPRQCSEILPEKLIDLAQKGWEALDRYKGEFSLLYPSAYESVSRILTNKGLEILRDDTFKSYSVVVPWVDLVHGDLNCRNILYNQQKDTFRIIDFPNVESSNCLAYDFVKAEAELILIMLDWGSGKDYNINRVQTWDELLTEYLNEFIPPARSFKDPELDRTFTAIRAVRETYQDVAAGQGQVELSYYLYLLSRVMHYLPYTDLTIAKRLLAFTWTARLFNSWVRAR